MSKLVWDEPGSRIYETGIDRGVLYPDGGIGVPWNGLISITEKPDGGEPASYYIDGVKFYHETSPEEYKATLVAFTYPDEFSSLDGLSSGGNGLSIGLQSRSSFGLSYRSQVGNDISEENYKIHLIYNAMASPSARNYSSINERPTALNFSWEISTRHMLVSGFKPMAHVVVETAYTDPSVLSSLEDILYGTALVDPSLPTPDELLVLFS